jgi:PAS domain S-box-containing protein
LNAVLRAIRNVNQLIVREKDQERLLQQACGILAEARGFRCVWIVRLGTDGRVEAVAEAGIGPPFAGLRSQLERGELPECCRRALASEGPVVLANPVVNCADCLLATEYRDTAGIAAPLRHEGRTYGVLIAALSAELAADAEEISLFAEAAGDLAFALHGIVVEQARQQAGKAVRDSEARYRALFQGTADGILIADLESRMFRYANPAVCRLLGYSEAELQTMGVADIHPKADLPAVLAEFEAQARGDKALAAGLPCLRKDGTIIYTDVSATAMSLDGEACTAGFFRDITERKRAQEALSRSLEATLSALGHAAEMRDPYTAGHQRRVTALATALARKLGLPDDACDTLRIAGLLHDVGKLGIPAEILSKPSQLSAIELALIRQHPHIAYDLLTDIPFPGPVAEIVLQHHERLDGSGYPHALVGGQILREARILAVADVVEAMASHRPYRPALGIDAALTEIRAGRETRYDQQVADACVALFESGEFSFQPATAG